MRQQSHAHDVAKTYPFVREDVTTTPFARQPVDVDDTVPVALYTRPYERIDIQLDSQPYERIEIAPASAVPPPSKALRTVFTISLLTCAFVIGFELALLLL